MELTRRNFLSVAGATGLAAAAAGAGLVSCAPAAQTQSSTSDAADTTSESATHNAVATYTCDICICGAGNSGLSAAVEAAQQGLGVVVLEKHGGTGGGGIGTEGVFAVNSAMQQEAGIKIEPAEVIATEMEYSHNRANGLKWLDLVQASGENISWLKDCGVHFTGVVDDYHGGMFETFHWFGENRAHDDFSPAMTQTAKDAGVQFLMNCPATDLIQDENGVITGVYAQKLNGDYVQVNAKAVVLATGGFANNDEYLQEGGFSDTTNVKRFLYGYDGDGVRMAMEAGGASNIPRMSGLMQLTVSGAPGGEYGTFGQGDGLVVAGHSAASMWINEDGERFCAESAGVENWMADMIPSLAHQKLYSIYDAKVFKDAYDGMIAPRIDWEATQEELQQRIDENPYGDFFSADTLDELAKKACDALELDYDTVIESINTYNDMCEAGDDAYFGKPAEYMQKLENPPYYFCYMPQACMVTFGGIRTNRKMEVVNKNGQPVPGLYSAGVDSADLWPNIYTINVPGGTNANNINSGRFASKFAAEYIGAEKIGSVSSEGDTSESVPDTSWSMPEGELKDGTYTDTQFGMFSDITVTVTIQGGKIAEITQENELETAYVGVAAMENTLIPAVIEAQSPAVDTVAGATRTSDAFRTAVQNCCEQAVS
jgi:fumarate reductase flavoprotein subunit